MPRGDWLSAGLATDGRAGGFGSARGIELAEKPGGCELEVRFGGMAKISRKFEPCTAKLSGLYREIEKIRKLRQLVPFETSEWNC